MLPQQRPQLVLETHLLMMLFLLGNVTGELRQIRLAHRKCGVTGLPLEIRVIPALLLEPDAGDALDLLCPIRLADRAPLTAQQMDVILDAADSQWCALQLLGRGAEIPVQRITNCEVTREGATLFG